MNTENSPLNPKNQTVERIRQHWFLYMLLGLALIVLGVIGVIYAYYVSAMAMLWFGVILTIAGAFHSVYAFFMRYTSGLILHLLIGLLTLIIGISILYDPVMAISVFTVLVSVFLLGSGILQIAFSISYRPTSSWWVFLITGLVAVFLGLFLILNWETAGQWLIGLFISIQLFLTGWSMLYIAIAAKSHTI